MQSFNSIISTATPQFKYTDYYGFEINILVELARVLNFTYTIENPPDGKKNVRIYLLQNVIAPLLNIMDSLNKLLSWSLRKMGTCGGRWYLVRFSETCKRWNCRFCNL